MNQVNEPRVKKQQAIVDGNHPIAKTVIATNTAADKIGLTESVNGKPAITSLTVDHIIDQSPELKNLTAEQLEEMKKQLKALLDLILALFMGLQMGNLNPSGQQLSKLLSHSLQGAAPQLDQATLNGIFSSFQAQDLAPNENEPDSSASQLAQTHRPFMEGAVTNALVQAGLTQTAAETNARLIVQHVANNDNTPIDPALLTNLGTTDPAIIGQIPQIASHSVDTVLHAMDFKNALLNSYQAEKVRVDANTANQIAEDAVRKLFGVSLVGTPLPVNSPSVLGRIDDAIRDLGAKEDREKFVDALTTMKGFLDSKDDMSDLINKIAEAPQTLISLMSASLVPKKDDYTPLLSVPV
jgi:hypothetical protein